MNHKAWLSSLVVAVCLVMIASFSSCKSSSKVEGQDYVSVHVLLTAPSSTEAVRDSRNFFTANTTPKTFTLLETSQIYNTDSAKLASFNARQFLRYHDRKLLVSLTIAEATTDIFGNKREDFIQELTKERAYKDLFNEDYPVGDFDLTADKINRNRPTLLVFTLRIRDPFYDRFINVMEGRANNLRGVLISLKQSYMLSSVADPSFGKPLEFKTDWGNLYTFEIEDKSRFFNPSAISKYDVTPTWGGQSVFDPASSKTPRFIIANGGAGSDLIYTYPPLIVYSKDFPETATNTQKAMDDFFQSVGKGFF